MARAYPVCLDCLGGVPPGREMDYLVRHFDEMGMPVEDIEIHPRQRAIIWFERSADSEEFVRRGFGGRKKNRSLAGIISQGFYDWWYGTSDAEEPIISEHSIPEAVYREVHSDNNLSRSLNDKFGAICVRTHASGTLLRAPTVNLREAYEYLRKKFDTLFKLESKKSSHTVPGAAKRAGGGRSDLSVHGRGMDVRPKATLHRQTSKDVKEFEMKVSVYTLEYLMHVCTREYDELCNKFDLVIEYQEGTDDKGEVPATISTRSSGPHSLKKGYEEFKNLYARYHYTLKIREIGLGDCKWSKAELHEKQKLVKKRCPKVFIKPKKRYTDHGLPISLTIVGIEADVEKAAHLLRGAMTPKPEHIHMDEVDDDSAFLESSSQPRRPSARSAYDDRLDSGHIPDVLVRPEDIELDDVTMFELSPKEPRIMVYQGSIVEQKVQALANAADRELWHVGGVARSISMAAGPELQRQCTEYVRQNGRLRFGEVAVSSGYRLNIPYVFHAAGPYKKLAQAEQILEDTCFNILRLTEQYGVESIAIPTISTGTFMMTKEDFAVAFCDAYLDHLTQTKQHTLKTICIVDVDVASVIDMCDVFENIMKPRGAIKKIISKKELQKILKQTPLDKSHLKKVASEKDGALGQTRASKPSLSADMERVTESLKHFTASSTPTSADVKPDFGRMEDLTDPENPCPICLYTMKEPTKFPKCSHEFCKNCLEEALCIKAECPICKTILAVVDGNQPDGTMTHRILPVPLPGHPKRRTIEITYHFPDGVQTSKHPNPGVRYTGTTRYAFLPNSREGKEVLGLLYEAFRRRLLFTIGTSITTGKENVVVWNDVHQKTRMDGGPTCFGYPDPTYLKRVKEELAAKGVGTKK